MRDWQPKKPLKKSWHPFLLNLPIIGRFFMHEDQKQIYDYTHNTMNKSQKTSFKKTKTYKMALKQLPYYEKISIAKNRRERAAYAAHMELAIEVEKIKPNDIKNFLENDFSKRRTGYIKIEPLQTLGDDIANEYISFYLKNAQK